MQESASIWVELGRTLKKAVLEASGLQGGGFYPYAHWGGCRYIVDYFTFGADSRLSGA